MSNNKQHFIIDVPAEKTEEEMRRFFNEHGIQFVTANCTCSRMKRKAAQAKTNRLKIQRCMAIPQQNPEPEVAARAVEDTDCPHCYLTPCVATHDFDWLGDGQQPCEENIKLRLQLYNKFWRTISNIGGWHDPRYLAKKTLAADGAEWAIQHKREVMPDCVLTKVRELYPNPKGLPYIGHMW